MRVWVFDDKAFGLRRRIQLAVGGHNDRRSQTKCQTLVAKLQSRRKLHGIVPAQAMNFCCVHRPCDNARCSVD